MTLVTYNRGQNSLGQMSFALKEAFPVCELLPFTANAPLPPPLPCWLLEEDKLGNSSMTFSSAFNIAMGGGGLNFRSITFEIKPNIQIFITPVVFIPIQ